MNIALATVAPAKVRPILGSTQRFSGGKSAHDCFLTEASSPAACGARMAAYLELHSARMVSLRTKRNALLAVTRLRSSGMPFGKIKAIPQERAFSIQLYLRPTSSSKLCYRNRPVAVEPEMQEGSVAVVDLEREVSICLGTSFDVLQIYIPRSALDEFADEYGGQRCDTLIWPFGKVDPVLRSLGLSILPALEQSQPGYKMYVDHLLMTLLAYVASAYGSITTSSQLVRGGLASWQTQRATEMLRANIDGSVSLTQIAAECQLSVSHFVRAFKQTLGQPPHRWLIEQRIEASKKLLLQSRSSLADIAIACGFADQACFTRTFRRSVQSTPGEWRRAFSSGPSAQ